MLNLDEDCDNIKCTNYSRDKQNNFIYMVSLKMIYSVHDRKKRRTVKMSTDEGYSRNNAQQ